MHGIVDNPERWWRCTPTGADPCERPAGTAHSIFTTLQPHAVSAGQWVLHTQRLGAPPSWLGSWKEALAMLQPWTQPRHVARIVVDNPADQIWLSLREVEPYAGPIRLQVVPGHWPAYQRKWWQRQSYDRARPVVHAGHRMERLLIDAHTQQVWESDTANIVAQIGGQLISPDPCLGPLLYGTELQRLVTDGRVRLAPLTLAQLQRAEEIWLCNALLGLQTAQLV